MNSPSRSVAAAALLLLAGCEVGPDYERPAAPIPSGYKEAGWQIARPADAIDRGAWWSIYHDPVLDKLERQVDVSNQNLKSAEAAFREAETIVTQARAGYFPSATANTAGQRSRNPGIGGGGGGGSSISNLFSLNEQATWTPDLWGRIRRTVESDVATAQASAGDLASARLSIQGQLASDYVQLRVADELSRLLQAEVRAFAESLRITRNQYRAGTSDQSAVSQAEAQLEATRAQLVAVGVTRAQFEHAIAVLIGKPPAEVSIATTTQALAIPTVPPEMPGALLQRRPDIAAGERRMAAANAQIGVAEAAFYPDITLSAQSGVTAATIAKLLTASARAWSFGGTMAQTVFDAGLNQAKVEQARATFDATVADYRQTVLTALQQVEDELAALRILADQAKAQEAALAAAREAERVINNQYLSGTVAYTNVIVAETTALSDAISVLNIRQSRLTASVALIQALGGGWDASKLPDRDRIEADQPLTFNPYPPADGTPKLR